MVAVRACSWKEGTPLDVEPCIDLALDQEHLMHLAPYGRFWAVYEAGVLVCVCVYKRGATEVIRRLTEVQGATL